MTTNDLEARVSRLISTQQVWVLEQIGRIEATPATVSETSIQLLNLHELSLSRQTLQQCIDTLNQDVERAHALRQTQGEIIAQQTEIFAQLAEIKRMQIAQGRNIFIGVTVVFILLVLLVIVISGQFSILQRLVAALGST